MTDDYKELREALANELPRWHFMRDNHTFIKLPAGDADESMLLLEKHRDELKYGMLSCRGEDRGVVHCSADIDAFLLEASEWMTKPAKRKPSGEGRIDRFALDVLRLLAERDSLKKQVAALRMIDTCRTERIRIDNVATLALQTQAAGVESEREANAILTAENDALRAELDRLKIAASAEDAAKLVDKKWQDYDAERGNTDHETGAREYPGDGNEYVWSMQELADEIRALSTVKVTK